MGCALRQPCDADARYPQHRPGRAGLGQRCIGGAGVAGGPVVGVAQLSCAAPRRCGGAFGYADAKPPLAGLGRHPSHRPDRPGGAGPMAGASAAHGPNGRPRARRWPRFAGFQKRSIRPALCGAAGAFGGGAFRLGLAAWHGGARLARRWWRCGQCRQLGGLDRAARLYRPAHAVFGRSNRRSVGSAAEFDRDFAVLRAGWRLGFGRNCQRAHWRSAACLGGRA